MSENYLELKEKCHEIRELVLRMCANAGTGHVTSSFSCAEILVALYYGGVMRFNKDDDKDADRDRFILSKGQASVILYTILGDLGFYDRDEIWKFCKADGIFGVHLQHDVPGVEFTTGSLGHGLGVATGIALTHKMNRTLPLTFALLGDGECYEGSIWESAMFAAHNNLNNLVAIVDRNYLCATHFTENSLSIEPLDEKWKSFGWEVTTVDGHSIEEIMAALKDVRARKTTAPKVIICETIKGKGVEFMSNHPLWHAVAPSGEDVEKALKELNENKVGIKK